MRPSTFSFRSIARLWSISFIRMVRDSATAEDLAQEVFLRVYRARHGLRREREIHHLAFPHRHEPGAEFASRLRYRQMEVSLDAPADDRRGAAMQACRRANCASTRI